MGKQIGFDIAPEIGLVVYKSYTPGKLFKIIHIHPLDGSDNPEFDQKIDVVDEKNIKHEKIPANHLADYQSLIDDHKRKYENHIKRLEKFKQTVSGD